MFGVLIALVFGGMAAFPLKNFLLQGSGQEALGWLTLLFFLGVPLVALITWLVRRIMSVRSKNHYLGYTFGGLWLVGLFCFIFLMGSFARNFKVKMPVEEKITLATPNNGRLNIDVNHANLEYYHGDWFGFRFNDEVPVYGVNMDTLMLNTVRIKLTKSKDSSFHVTKVRFSQGNSREIATSTAQKIRFDIQQQDSVLFLPEGFAVSSADKFRGQQVLVVIEIPVGKKIQLTDAVKHYNWFDINMNNRRGWNINFDDYYNDGSYDWEANTEYIMIPDGLKRVDELDPIELRNGRFKIIINADGDKVHVEGDFEKKDNKNHYRYKQLEDSIKEKVKDKLREELKVKDSIDREKKLKEIIKTSASNTKQKKNDTEEEMMGTGHMVSPALVFSEI